MKVGIIFIGTDKYKNFFPGFQQRINKFLFQEKNVKKTIFAFSDAGNEKFFPDCEFYPIEHEPWPYITLKRFAFIEQAYKELSSFQYMLFLDSDLAVDSVIKFEEIFNDDKKFTGVVHPGFSRAKGLGTYEFYKKNSKAYVKRGEEKNCYYHQGCLWGGRIPDILDANSEMRRNVQEDLNNDIVACWHDESHLNRFFLNHYSELHSLHPGFAYPERWNLQHKKRIIHLYKPMDYYPRFAGSGK